MKMTDTSLESSQPVCCCRNVHDMFKQWWCIPYNCSKPYRAELYRLEGEGHDYAVSWTGDQGDEGLPEILLNRWEFMIYVRLSNDELGKLHKAYYESLGGQMFVCCGIHEFPLVFAAYKNEQKCQHSFECQRSVVYECVEHDCGVCLCQTHFETCKRICLERNNGAPLYFLSEEDNLYDGQEQSTQSSMDVDDDMDQDEEMTSSDRNSVNSNSSDNLLSVCSHASDEHWDISMDDALVSDENDECLSTGDIAFVSDCNSFDCDHFEFMVNPMVDDELMDDDNAIVQQSGMNIVNTVPGTQEQDVNFTLKGAQKIHAYVLINSFGKCLIRRGRRLMGNKVECGFLQRILATHGDSIPLLYPEGMLFPSIFWKAAIRDQSLFGALPGSLFTDNHHAALFNLAGASKHFQARLRNNNLKCSTDPNYASFVFSVISNIGLRGQDTRSTVKRRGAQAIFGNKGPSIQNDTSTTICNRYMCEVIDSDRSVNCLATMNRHMNPGLFYTHTLNQANHPGIRCITELVNKKCDEIEREMVNSNVSACLIAEMKQSLHQAASTAIFRCYRKVMESAINWILYSSDEPLGKVNVAWIVSEFSEDSFKPTGNMEHFHMVLYLDEDISKPDVLHEVRSRVRCSIEHL